MYSPNNKIIAMNKERSSSDFQRMFSTQEAFKRNRNYYDVLKINEQEHNNEKKRRKPNLLKVEASTRIQSTFQSAKKEIKHKVEEDIEKFKFRLSFYNQEDNPQSQSTHYEETSPKERETSPRNIKGVPHEKFLSRQSLHQLRNKPCIDERQFNNFYITKNDLSQTPNISNYSPRNLSIALEHMTDLYYDSQQKYQQVYFDKKTTSCIFNLKKQNDTKGRYFFVPKREEDKPSTDMKPENVAKSFSVANPYKTDKILNFYRINGRELPSQFDQRFLSSNKNFYKDKDGKLVKQEMSFTARKYKDQLMLRDLEEIKKSKKPYFDRDEICDERYFKQQKRRM